MMNNREIVITGFGGSLRTGSLNLLLLKDAANHMPAGSRLDIADISGIPIYNQDLEEAENESVTQLREKIRHSQGFLVVTPEYNFSLPGYLKNVIDVVSRPTRLNPFTGKPGAIMSASTGMLGGSRAQYHPRQIFAGLDSRIVNKPEVFVTFAQNKFDADGHLKDEPTIKFVRDLLNNLVAEAKKLPE